MKNCPKAKLGYVIFFSGCKNVRMMQNLFEWVKHNFLYLQHSFSIHSQWGPVALGKNHFLLFCYMLCCHFIFIFYICLLWYDFFFWFIFSSSMCCPESRCFNQPNKGCNCKYCKWVANNKWYLSLIQEIVKICGIIDLKSQHWLKSSI